MSKKQHEFKRLTFPGLVTKVDESAGIVIATVNVLGIIDEGEDIVEKGAFTKTIQENFGKIRVLDSHQTRSVIHAIGKPIRLAEIGRNDLPDQLKQDYPMATGGLYTETQFMLDDPTSLAVFKRLKEGYVTEWSIGFEIILQEYRKVKNAEGKEQVVRVIKEARLLEYSSVLWGMNQATYTEGVKSDEPQPTPETASTDEHKEMTPDGAVSRLGDWFKAGVYDAFMEQCNALLSGGYMNGEEHRALCQAGMRMMDMIDGAMSEDMALRPITMLWSGEEWILFNLLEAQRLLKVGRTISAATGKKLTTALENVLNGAEMIEELLTAAGVLGNDEEDTTEEMSQQNAESEHKPLTETDYSLEIELFEAELAMEME